MSTWVHKLLERIGRPLQAPQLPPDALKSDIARLDRKLEATDAHLKRIENDQSEVARRLRLLEIQATPRGEWRG